MSLHTKHLVIMICHLVRNKGSQFLLPETHRWPSQPPPDRSKQIHNVKNLTNTAAFFSLSKITSCRLADQGPRTCSRCPAGPWLTCQSRLVWHPSRRLECPQSAWQVGWSCPDPWGRSPLTLALLPEATKGEGVCFFVIVFFCYGWLGVIINYLSFCVSA